MKKIADYCLANQNYETDENGFTLIEVLVAIAIFAIGMLAIGSMQIGAMQGTTTARSNTELAALASDQMERLTGLPYDHEDLAEGNHGKNDFNDNRFSTTWDVVEDDVFLDTKTVTLTAEENPGRGSIKTLTLQHVVLKSD